MFQLNFLFVIKSKILRIFVKQNAFIHKKMGKYRQKAIGWTLRKKNSFRQIFTQNFQEIPEKISVYFEKFSGTYRNFCVKKQKNSELCCCSYCRTIVEKSSVSLQCMLDKKSDLKPIYIYIIMYSIILTKKNL